MQTLSQYLDMQPQPGSKRAPYRCFVWGSDLSEDAYLQAKRLFRQRNFVILYVLLHKDMH